MALRSVGGRGPCAWTPHSQGTGRQWRPLREIHREPQPSHLDPSGQGPGGVPWRSFLSQACVCRDCTLRQGSASPLHAWRCSRTGGECLSALCVCEWFSGLLDFLKNSSQCWCWPVPVFAGSTCPGEGQVCAVMGVLARGALRPPLTHGLGPGRPRLSGTPESSALSGSTSLPGLSRAVCP